MTHADHISSLVTATLAASRAYQAARKSGTAEEIEAARYNNRIARAAAQRAVQASIAQIKSGPVGA